MDSGNRAGMVWRAWPALLVRALQGTVVAIRSACPHLSRFHSWTAVLSSTMDCGNRAGIDESVSGRPVVLDATDSAGLADAVCMQPMLSKGGTVVAICAA